MTKTQQIRIIFILCTLLALSTATGLILYALKQNIDLYFTPSQLIAEDIPDEQSIKLGGMVKEGSFHRGDHLKSSFILTDYQHQVQVFYDGVLPALFREGQGLVVQGHLNKQGDFVATQVFAKHDESYRPPNIPETAMNSHDS